MGGGLFEDVARWLDLLEATQVALLDLFRRKKSTLTRLRVHELAEIAREECRLVEQLQRRLARRDELLAAAQRAGLPHESLTELVAAHEGPAAAELSDRIESARTRSETLRRESWVQWIVTQRSSRHFGELLELIAHRGEGAPTYDSRQSPANAGAFLDASA